MSINCKIEHYDSSQHTLSDVEEKKRSSKNNASPALIPTNDLHPFVFADLHLTAKKYYTQSSIDQKIATFSIVFFATLFVGVTILTFMFFPKATPIVLGVEQVLSELIYSKIYSKYATRASQKLEYAKHAEGIAKKIEELRKTGERTNNYSIKLIQLGLNPFKIKHRETLQHLDSKNNPDRSLVNLVGRVEYWSDLSNEYQQKIDLLNKEIETKAKEMTAPKLSEEKVEEIKSALLVLQLEKHQLEEEKCLPAKLSAAYNFHIITNVKEKRSIGEFGKIHPFTHLESLTFKMSNTEQPFYHFKQERNRSPLSKNWILNHTVNEIAREIFETKCDQP